MKFPILSIVSLLIQLIVVIVGVLSYKRLAQPMHFLVWLVAFAFGEAITGTVLAILGIHNLWLSHISTIIEFLLIIYIYSLWVKTERARSIMFVCLIAFCVTWIISKFTFESFLELDGWTAAIARIMQIIFSTVLLIEVIREEDVIWTQDPRFWVAAGIIIYSSGSLFVFALFNEMLQISPSRLLEVYSMNWILLIISNLFYVRGLTCRT